MIRKIGRRKYRLVSKRTKRNLGTFTSRSAAVKREQQIRYFKKKRSGAPK